MKTRFFAISALCVLALAASCQKAENEFTLAPGKATITASIDEDTKTAYANETTFSWVSGDRVLILVTDSETDEHEVNHFTYATQQDGTRVAFEGTAFGPGAGNSFEKWVAAGYALYPNVLGRSGNKDDIIVTLPYEYTVTGSNFMSIIPLLGVQDAENAGLYRFKTATGVIKLTFTNVPALASRLVLYSHGNKISGDFHLTSATQTDGFKMEDAAEAYYEQVAVNFPSQDAGSTVTVFMPIPVGVLSAGSYFSLERADGYQLFRTEETVRPIIIKRNTVKNFTPKPIAVPAPDVYLDDLLGEYTMTIYSAGPYSEGYAEPGDIVLVASDNSSKGNVMMTKFAGISGVQYGTFDGTYLVFPKDQIFGDNTINHPSVSASDWPYLAIDFFKGGVVDATFELLSQGKIKAVNADAMGFRACTEDSWLNDNHNGSWPWPLCFSAITAEWKSNVSPDTYTKGARIPLTSAMITASDVCTHDGTGVAGLIDEDSSTYWHSNYWLPVQKNDPVYGIYFDFALAGSIDAIQFNYQVREGNASCRPTSVVYGASNDGKNWTKVGACSDDIMSDAGSGSWVELPSVKLGSSYKYIRLGIVDSADSQPGSFTEDLTADGSALATSGSYHKSTNMAELELWWAE